MGEIIIISTISLLAVIQLYLSKYKIGKWILPSMSFVFSICLMIFGIGFAMFFLGDDFGAHYNFFDIFNFIKLFLEYNVPTVIFLIINNYRKNKLNEHN